MVVCVGILQTQILMRKLGNIKEKYYPDDSVLVIVVSNCEEEK